MRIVNSLLITTCAATLMLSLAPPILAQCTLDIESIVGSGEAGNLESIRVTGSADGCKRVELRLYCQSEGARVALDVNQGRWEVLFTEEQASRARCHCEGRIAVDAICVDGSAECKDEERESIECRSEEAAPGLQYAAKFVCGKPDQGIAAPGSYFTAITVHNPTDSIVSFRKKFAIAFPGQRPGPVTRFFRGRLGPDEAMEVDCPEILERFKKEEGFLKGFALIESGTHLDVITLYSAAGASGSVETMDIDRVPARRRPGCVGPDLIVTEIERPQYDGATNESVITAVVRNAGMSTAPPSIARVIDPSTFQATGAPYNAIAHVPELLPGDSHTVEFRLPYWVYNPDAFLEVTADYKHMVDECNEENNVESFFGLG